MRKPWLNSFTPWRSLVILESIFESLLFFFFFFCASKKLCVSQMLKISTCTCLTSHVSHRGTCPIRLRESRPYWKKMHLKRTTQTKALYNTSNPVTSSPVGTSFTKTISLSNGKTYNCFPINANSIDFVHRFSKWLLVFWIFAESCSRNLWEGGMFYVRHICGYAAILYGE